MFDKIELFQMAQGMSTQANARMAITARNVANADTPGYRAQDIASFAETYESPAGNMRSTRAGHSLASGSQAPMATVDAPGASSPNGNTVSLETEMMRSVEVRQQQELALAIYKSSLNILRTSLGRK